MYLRSPYGHIFKVLSKHILSYGENFCMLTVQNILECKFSNILYFKLGKLQCHMILNMKENHNSIHGPDIVVD